MLNRGQLRKMLRTTIADGPVMAVMFVRAEAVFEIGQRAGCKPTRLIDPALKKCPLDEFDGFCWPMIVMTGSMTGVTLVQTVDGSRYWRGPTAGLCRSGKR